MEELVKKLRTRLLIFRWVGIALGVFAFPMPFLLTSFDRFNGFTTGLMLVPVMVLAGIGCMIAGIVTRGKIKDARAFLSSDSGAESQSATPAATDEVTPVVKLRRDDK